MIVCRAWPPATPSSSIPNRDKAESKSTKAIVVALLLVSAAIVAIVAIGGWGTLSGAESLQIGYVVIYLVLAFYIARWRSGLLPVAERRGGAPCWRRAVHDLTMRRSLLRPDKFVHPGD